MSPSQPDLNRENGVQRLRQARESGQPIRLRIVSPSDAEKNLYTQLQWSDFWIKHELIKALGNQPGLCVTDHQPHAVLHLFGFPAQLDPRLYNLGWIYGHPDMVTDTELRQYDHLFCYSSAFRSNLAERGYLSDLMIGASGKQPRTGTAVQYPATFVGNARRGGGGRAAVEAALESGEPFMVWGNGWDKLDRKHFAAGYIDYHKLDDLYAASEFVLNDHHPDMARWGFVSFRIFDALASGGFVVSDRNPGIEEIFGRAVPQFSNGQELKEIFDYFRAHQQEKEELRQEGMRVALAHTWQKRAEQIHRHLLEVSDPTFHLPTREARPVQTSPVKPAPQAPAPQGPLPLCYPGHPQVNYFAKPVIIVGFHHSGTRLLAQLLHHKGVFQIADRPTYEWGFVQGMNCVLLPGWNNAEAVRKFDPARGLVYLSHVAIADLLQRAGYRNNQPWGHKDPRTCATLPAWLAVFPQASVVHIIRDPLDVLGTLPGEYAEYTPGGKLPQQDLPFWSGLWSAYTDQIVKWGRKAVKFVEVRFEDLCAQPAQELDRIVQGLGLEGGLPPDITSIKPGKVGIHRQWIAEGRLDFEGVEELKIMLAPYRQQYGYLEMAVEETELCSL